MNTTTSPNRGQPATRGGYKPLYQYDEERQEGGPVYGSCWSRAWPKRFLRAPRLRLRKATFCVLLIDLLIVVLLVWAFEPLITLLVRNEELFGARLALPHNTSSQSDQPRTIPRILHQTSATDDIPERWVAARQSCRDVYAEFEYKHWTDERARDFIKAEYPWFLDTWDNYPFPIQRADAIRYFVLHQYGGLYLDMDTICNETIPLHQIEAMGKTPHHAVFKSTKPTGVSNDLLISSSHHPVFAAAIAKLMFFNKITRFWAGLLPHAAVMISAGPFFMTQIVKDYLLEQPTLPSPTIQVVNATELLPYITDLEDCSWHHGDTNAMMWIGDHPSVWFVLGAIGLVIGLYIVNHFMVMAYKRGIDRLLTVSEDAKESKLM